MHAGLWLHVKEESWYYMENKMSQITIKMFSYLLLQLPVKSCLILLFKELSHRLWYTNTFYFSYKKQPHKIFSSFKVRL